LTEVCVSFFQWHPNYPCSGCWSECELLTAANGTLSDRSELSGYSNNADCQWIIAPLNAAQITLLFTEFSLQPDNDVVRVYQCSDVYCSQEQQLAELSGKYSTTQVVTSTTGFIKVVFTSDGTINDDGFVATWISVRMLTAVIVVYYLDTINSSSHIIIMFSCVSL
jgi:hypothetical protein